MYIQYEAWYSYLILSSQFILKVKVIIAVFWKWKRRSYHQQTHRRTPKRGEANASERVSIYT